jgi:hypothetical protein
MTGILECASDYENCIEKVSKFYNLAVDEIDDLLKSDMNAPISRIK